MNLLSPLSLIWFIPLGAIIVLLYLLKLKRKERMVSSVMLWQDAVADIQANAPFQKLKKSLLLLLQLIALLLLVFAVSRPFMKARGITDNKIVVILDSSASMQSTDVLPSRFENAKTKALDIVKTMGPGDSMLVMAAGTKSRVVCSFISDKRALNSAIQKLQPVDTPCNMRQAMVLAMSLVAGKSKTPPRIVVFSDGGFGSLSDLSARNARLDFIKIGSRCDNVAITGLDSRKTLSGEQQVFIGLHNYSTSERKCNLEIYIDDHLYDIREEVLSANATKQEMLKDLNQVGGRVTAKLDVKDDLAVDNSGSVYLTKPRKINVLLVTKGNVFLQYALNLDPRTQLTTAEAVPAKLEAHKYDMVVFDHVKALANLPQGGYLLIDSEAAQGPASIGSPVTRPAIVDSAKNHPASAYVDFAQVRISQASYLKPKPWATTIVEGEGGPLGVAGSNAGRNYVQLSFSILDSDFPLHVGFPIFIANCLDYLVPENSSNANESARTGQPVYINIPPDTSRLTVVKPDGSKQNINVTQVPVAFDDTELAGVYQVLGKGIKKEFACNLASMSESSAKPKNAFVIGEKRFTSTGKPIYTNREFYELLILAALFVLSFEWYAYHRRL